jgi:glutathione synthase
MRIGIAISRASSIETTWTTAYIIQCAAARGHEVRLIEPWDFEIDERGAAVARAWAIPAQSFTREALCQNLRTRRTPRCYVEVSGLDLLLLRINPMDSAVMVFAQLAADLGVKVLSRPETLLKTSHKAYLASLAAVHRPSTMVSRSPGVLRTFAESLDKGIVLKPARSSGGRGVRWVRDPRDPDLEVAVADVRRLGDGYVVAQEYLPEAEAGEKRLVWLDGEVLGGYLRRRAPGEFRHNLTRGGIPEPCVVEPGELEVVSAVTPYFKKDGVWLAGLDLIGGRIVEVNTLNPGGLHLVQHFSGLDLSARLIGWLEDFVSRTLPAAEPPELSFLEQSR